ncbi:response regulator [Catenulispora sp. NL8]|uniref:histidine kinase n=1 Tax=Catenulispora pinistramenti TaxID=2705254 RepID=A0ABS5KNH2_9ACTN|nr:hybrid sensor histidine kinase/response regulator [Catenulispora pinistramenti]MBS2547605.1 response regulator [Catenulispora pinistramenti]
MTDDSATKVRVIAVTDERDVFALRRDARTIAEAAGADSQDRIRLATALSELGRDRLGSAGVTVRFALTARPAPALEVTVRWTDGAPPDPEALNSARRLIRELSSETLGRQGSIVLRQPVALAPEGFAAAADRLAELLTDNESADREDDLRSQTRDLIIALEEARAQSEELRLLNEELEQTNAGVLALYAEISLELEQTNSGVVALHAELEDKSRQLREASESKTRFWANVSHELRSPLNSVIGLSRLLAASAPEELGPQQREQVALISASGETLLALVDDLLDVAKAEAGQLTPQPAPVDLALLLAQIEAVVRPAAPNPAVELLFPRPEALPPLVTDETMLTRVLRNLIGNSLKFTESGHVRLSVRQAPDQAGMIEFVVEDTGIGIPPQEQAKVFEEFHQVRGAHQRGKAGTGLGLPYARSLVTLLGGTIELTSTVGAGTTVIAALPVVQAPEPVRLPLVAAADDDPAFAAVFRPMLETVAEQVVQLPGGRELVEFAVREQPSAVVVDLDMPGTDGYEVVRRLAADPRTAATPVVVVTGYPAARVDRARLAHVRAVLSKDTVDAAALGRALGPRRPGSSATSAGGQGGSP